MAPRHTCPNLKNHTECPERYMEWYKWAEKMSKTHDQNPCNYCGLLVMWEAKKEVK
jgi:hypothetical protein